MVLDQDARRRRRSRPTISSLSRKRRIKTLVRRSTKRCVSRSCSASDSVSSIARVRPCQCSGSSSQSARFDTKVQVRIWASRLASVSMSPSVRSASATWCANQSAGILPSVAMTNR